MGDPRPGTSGIPVIGLTGGIATGKSTVSDLIRAAGIPVLDADRIAREVVLPGNPAYHAILEAFGTGILQPDGRIDRARLGHLVFADADARRRLNAIVHPPVRRIIASRLKQLDAEGARFAVVDIPLLFETGDPTSYVEVVVVYADPAVQLQRLMARDGLSETQAMRRIAAQMPIDEKARRADTVIDNGGSLARTRAQVDALISRWQRTYAPDVFSRRPQ